MTSGTHTSSEQGRTAASRKQAGTYALSEQAKKRFLARTGLPRANRAELLRNPMKSMINPQIGSVYEKKLPSSLSSLTWLGERGEFPNFFSTSDAATETLESARTSKAAWGPQPVLFRVSAPNGGLQLASWGQLTALQLLLHAAAHEAPAARPV